MPANFITANDTVRRLSDEHAKLRDQAVEEINKIIRAAGGLPVAVPKKLLTEVDVVRAELLRKLEEEAGWRVAAHGPYGPGTLDEPDAGLMFLDHPTRAAKEERRR